MGWVATFENQLIRAGGLVLALMLTGCWESPNSFQSVGREIQSSVVPNLQRFVRSNPLNGDRQENIGPQGVPTFSLRFRSTQFRTPHEFTLVDHHRDYFCETAEGPLASYLALIEVELISGTARSFGNLCQNTHAVSLTDFPFDRFSMHWISLVIKRRLAVYENHLYTMSKSGVPAEQLAAIPETHVFLCQNDNLALYAMRTKGSEKTWALIAWKSQENDGYVDIKASRYFPIEIDQQDPAATRISSQNQAVSGQILLGGKIARMKFPKIEGLSPESQSTSMECAMGPQVEPKLSSEDSMESF